MDRYSCLFIIGLLAAYPAAADTAVPLSLDEAERLALARDPLTAGLQARAEALEQQAVADGQLPDPQLKLGIDNLPVDSFDRSGDDMTMLVVGVQQAFPRGRSLRYARERTAALASAGRAEARNQRQVVLREVRNAYLDLYFRHRAEAIVEDNRYLFTQLLEVTEAQYGAGRDNQQEVLRAQLELSRLDDRLLSLAQERDEAAAALARRIPLADARRPVPEDGAGLPAPPPLEGILAALEHHPLLQAEDARVSASERDVAVAREQYKPGWMLDLSYGERAGGRSDMLTAMVLVELPLFRSQRQDRRLAASRQEHLAAGYARADRLLELTSLAAREYSTWERLGQRHDLYRRQVLPEADQAAEAELFAYQTGVGDFNSLLRARIDALDAELEALRLEVERAKAQANLLYLGGE